MQVTQVHIYEIDVVFDPEAEPKVSLAGDVTITGGRDRKRTVIGKPPGIPQGVHLLRFRLVADNLTVFPSDPIEWIPTREGFAKPPDLLLHWQTPDQFGLVIFNVLGIKTSYDFNVVVSYKGELYSTDPTVICDPPGLPPEPQPPHPPKE